MSEASPGSSPETPTPALKRTPLYEEHLSSGGKMVPFAGWEMPVQYSGVVAEHRAVREAVGLFDVSHMGEVWVTGPEALALLQSVTCNDVAKIVDGMAQYSALTTESGGIVDDLIIYRFGPERFFLCVNASNADEDIAWLHQHNHFNATVTDVCAEFAQIALQGPRSFDILNQISDLKGCDEVPYFRFTERQYRGAKVIVARTGYTGEDGVEIFCPPSVVVALWRELEELGRPLGLLLCGLGARDSLRLEACLPLHGHELGKEISAIESGLKWIVKPAKGEFIGRSTLLPQCEKGAPRALVGFEIKDRGIARAGDRVVTSDGKEIGVVTSGTRTPWLEKAIGLALISSEMKGVGTSLAVEVRGKPLAAEVVKTPFYKRSR